MAQIKFSHNWNDKLRQRIFTTIRSWNIEKEKYYKNLLAHEFDVLLKGKLFCKAKLQEVEVFDFKDIPNALLMSDTGLEFNEAQDLFAQFGLEAPEDTAILLTFKLIKGVKE